jgi:hypothetical protein
MLSKLQVPFFFCQTIATETIVVSRLFRARLFTQVKNFELSICVGGFDP